MPVLNVNPDRSFAAQGLIRVSVYIFAVNFFRTFRSLPAFFCAIFLPAAKMPPVSP